MQLIVLFVYVPVVRMQLNLSPQEQEAREMNDYEGEGVKDNAGFLILH